MDRPHLEQMAALNKLRDDDHSDASIDDVVSGVFPAYSSRESVNSDTSSICKHGPVVGPEQGVAPCYNFTRGVLFVIVFGKDGDVDYQPFELADLPDDTPGRFHCFDCGLHFENKISLQLHLLRSGNDLDDKNSRHIVCPVCFAEFMPPNRVDRMAEHLKDKHNWEYQFVTHGKGLPGPHTGFNDNWRQYMEFCREDRRSPDMTDQYSEGYENSDSNSATGVWFCTPPKMMNKKEPFNQVGKH